MNGHQEQKSILVTGASSGIGYLLTKRLSREGHLVYATARSSRDLRMLASMTNVTPLNCDLTNSKSITAAAEEVSRARSGLYAVVNNAGVATFGGVLDCSEAELDLVMSVNVRGTYLITRAFAPMIIEQKGRIVTLGSISGILAEKNVSAYSMSKHAVEAFVDAFSQEMAPLGVGVSIIEPGVFRTRLAENIRCRIGGSTELPDLSCRDEPHAVVHAICKALFDQRHKRRYLVCATQDEANKTIRKQIEQLVQLNYGHSFSMDRNELIRVLDEEITVILKRG